VPSAFRPSDFAPLFRSFFLLMPIAFLENVCGV